MSFKIGDLKPTSETLSMAGKIMATLLNAGKRTESSLGVHYTLKAEYGRTMKQTKGKDGEYLPCRIEFD